MNILHWMRKETSGLTRSTVEIAAWEQKAGHTVCIKQPAEAMPLYGVDKDMDIHSVHSQINPAVYGDKKAKIMWMHGEPLSSVGNGASMKAIIDLAPKMDCFICMREEEEPVWSQIKRTYRVPKGIDLEIFKPLDDCKLEKLSGEPAVLYVENWRGQRNPLYACVAMALVHQRLPNARLHLYNCTDQKMLETFKELHKHCKWWPFLRTIQGPVDDINELYNKADMVISGLYPLYARGIEAFGAGKGFVGPGYREYGYPYTCNLEPYSMAAAVIKLWEEWGKVDFRKWAEDHHDIKETVKQAVEIYERYV